jgi:hypothetical protein
MAREPDDRQVTDLARYRKAREAEARRPPPRPLATRQPLLGANPRAGLILAIAAIVLLALTLGPRFL